MEWIGIELISKYNKKHVRMKNDIFTHKEDQLDIGNDNNIVRKTLGKG